MIYLECTVRIAKQTRPDALSWREESVTVDCSVTYSDSASRDELSTCSARRGRNVETACCVHGIVLLS